MKLFVSPTGRMVSSVSPLNKKEPNGIQETNARPVQPVVVVVIQMDFTSVCKARFRSKLHSFICQYSELPRRAEKLQCYY